MSEFLKRKSISSMAKPKRFALFGIVMVLVVTMLFSMFNVNAFGAQADDSTIDRWKQTTGQDTKNIGRIWTDKSVHTADVKLPGGNTPEVAKGDSDFLVTLSALSSAGKITGAKTSVKPLDIVMVFDTSASMADDMVTYTYTETYNINTNGGTTYYAQVDGKYVEVERVTTGWRPSRFDHWEVNGQEVEPKTSANDNTEGHIQFYTRRSNNTGQSKMAALKSAANAFIDSTAEANKVISGDDKKHRISLVTFASDAEIAQSLIVCDTNNSTSMKQIINGLGATGGTQADDGMLQAQSALNDAREGAQKVVIFFTDGEPGNYGFDEDVANPAIQTAKTLKSGENGALIYSIGMFGDADPSDTSQNFNGYMHGISSNYPDATAWNNLGQRAENSDYYKSATNASQLNEVFSKIFEEISVIEASSPVKEDIGGGEDMAAITFHDELGDYMKVDDFKAIVFADQVFENPTVMESPIEYEDKKVIQYEFTGKGGNTIYPDGDLAEIEITVERYNDPAKGDVVTVTIPASMIPLREYEVDTREGNKKMTIDDTYPLRIFYGASLKAEAETLLANPDDAMQAYIDNNTEDGQVNFYSNKYYAGGENNGGVYVEFTPNETNDFYYFQENEPLYLDEACTQRATESMDTTGNTIYYYDRIYYNQIEENGKTVPQEEHNIVEIPGNSNLVLGNFVKSDAEGLYVPSGTPRTTSLATHALNKTDEGLDGNITGTAPYVTAPDWDNIYQPEKVIVKLGNNGLLPVDLPGTLEVAKTVDVIEGNPDADTEFTFEITLNGNDAQSEYTAQKFNSSGQADGAQQTITFADNKATVTLKAGEKIELYGLTAGVDYTVAEKNLPKGFTAKDNTDTLNGEIAAGEKSSAAFVNEYTAKELIIHSDDSGLKGTKNITSTGDVEKVFEVGDIFRFDITPSDATNYPSPLPTPASATLEVKEDSTFKGAKTAEISFGEFTFTEEGEYRYSIREHLATSAADDKIVPGIKYDTTNYRLVLNVADDGKGQLKITHAEITKNSGAPDDFTWEPVYDGETLPEGDATHLVFNNTYEGEQQTISLAARKTMNKLLTDYSGAEQFGFVVTGAEEGQPMPAPATEGAYAGKYVYKNDTTGTITIPGITFEPTDAGADGSEKEYTYYINELQPTVDGTVDGKAIDENAVFDDSTGKWTYKGVTFDNTTKTVKVTVSSKHVNGKEEVDVVIDYGATDDPNTPDVDESLPVFTNTYNASVETAAITGTKKITGREFKANDEFTFNITANNGGPLPANVNDGKVTINPTSGEEATIAFGKIAFDEDDMKDAAKTVTDGHASYEKTFEYTITEAAGSDAAIKYDTAPRTLSITVRDDGYGNMTVTNTTMGSNTDDELVWTNEYNASMDYSGISISKTLKGRMMKAGEFDFTITPKDGTDTPALGASDASFKNGAKGDGVADVMNKLSSLKFTQDDAGKTFTYIIDETDPAVDDNANKAGVQSKGVTYDQSKYEVVIKPTDNGDGTMSADTKVTRIRNASGETVSEEVAIDAIAFNNTYAADPGTLIGSAALEVTKSFIGREENQWLESDEFTFNIEFVEATLGGDESAVTMPANTTITIDDEDADKKASFGDIKFAKTGTYTFRISEDTTGLSDKGITAKTEPRIVKIVVSDPGDGTLVAVKDSSTSQGLFFENTYRADAATFGNINVEKVLTGRLGGTWLDTDAFEFKLEAADDATTAAVNSGAVELPDSKIIEIKNDDKKTADGYSEKFDAIKFTRAGEYSFNVTELEGGISGVKYDTAAKIVNVVVIDNDKGALIAQVETTVDNEGTLTDSTTVTFTNTYTPADADPVATTGLFTKVIDGRDWLDDDEFTFTITPQDGAPAPTNTTAKVTKADVTNDGTAAFDFGTITFTADDMTGAVENNGVKTKIFTYTVKEAKAGTTEKGLTYSENVATMTITVTDDGTGKLKAGATVENDKFVNIYNSTLDYKASVNMFITKVLEGRELEADQFGFTMTPANQESADKFGIALAGREHFTRAADIGEESQMQVVLGEDCGLFTADDVGKTYSYTVKETKVGDTGYTNDTEVATVTITTTDDNKGTLTVTTTVEKGGKTTTTSVSTGEIKQGETPKTIKIPFVNYYNEEPGHLSDDGDATIEATKEITGRDLKDGEFNFTVTDKNGKEVATGTNDADGTIHFTDIEYAMETMEEDVDNGIATVDKESKYPEYIYTYQYTVSEKTEGLADKGITASTPQYNITVTVTDDAKGSLNIKVGYPEDKEGLEFKNQYGKDTANVAISGQKVLTMLSGDKIPDIANKYTFKLTGSDGAPMPANDTAKNAADGTIAFGDIIYTMDNTFGNEGTDRREKTFTYTVTETGTVTGVDNDGQQTFSVKVVDDGNGHIAAESTVTDGALFRFDNKYSVDPIESSITDTIKIKKNLGGDREMKAGEFKFELVEGDNVVVEATNDADGNVTFGKITYKDAGTHEYTVREVNNGLGGIIYDTNLHKIGTNVTDNGDGTLSVEHKRVATTEEEQKADIVFTNTYKATPASVTLGAAKILKNGELKDGQFIFVLKDSKGDIVSEAKNDAKGSIKFDAMEFDKAGTFEYTVSEVKGNDKDIKYDENEYKITIEVKDDGNGNMTAEITKGIENGIVFVNTVEAGAGTETGDDMPLAALAIVMMAATGAGIVTVRRKIKH